MPNIFPERLKKLRTHQNVKQKDLAALLSVGIRTIVNYENGSREPNIDGLNCLANYFGVSLDYLTGRTDDRTLNKPKRLFYNPDGELFYYFSVEDTMQPDFMKCRGIELQGNLKYSFGIFQDTERKQNRHFLYLDSIKDSSIYPYLLTGRGHIVFLALVSFINLKLGFQYNPYNPDNMDIIIAVESKNFSRFVCIEMIEKSPTRLSIISTEYCNFLDEYLKKTTTEKAAYLSTFLIPKSPS